MSKQTNAEHRPKHVYKDYGHLYRKKGYAAIPEKFMSKMPAIKQWSDYCHRLPSHEEIESWIDNFTETGISICMGKASGIVALDLDATDPKILDLIIPLLPESPVQKVGQKGFTRFFKFNGEHTEAVKHNGEVILEILSTGKKCTIPPSIHPCGDAYKWEDKTLLDINREELPILPPALLASIGNVVRSKFPEVLQLKTGLGHFKSNGRNNDIATLAGKLIEDNIPVDEAIIQMLELDKTFDVSLFNDPDENQHTDARTNALRFYSSILDTVQRKRFFAKEEYHTVNLGATVNKEYAEALESGKSRSKGSEKRLKNLELPDAQGALKIIQQNILSNSWVKQPDMAFAASLALLSTLVSRKILFRKNSPNLYLLNIAPSGSGKDAPQKLIKKYLTDVGADFLLGAGDYVSDASLMDSLSVSPVRLDVMDEAGGILKTFTKGGSDYNKKMADILCELYTSSNDKFLGRATAEGTKGSCYRPNVNILASTTPTGFSEGVSTTAIEKGLLGRFLVFFGDGDKPAELLEDFPPLPKKTQEFIRHWAFYEPPVNEDISVGGIEQRVLEIDCNVLAAQRLQEVFYEMDDIRTNSDPNDPLRPIIARLFQQMSKILILHSVSRCGTNEPSISVDDIEFARKTVLYYFERLKEGVSSLIYRNNVEKDYAKILEEIPYVNEEPITKLQLSRRTRHMGKRDAIIKELLNSGEILTDIKQIKGKRSQVFWRI